MKKTEKSKQVAKKSKQVPKARTGLKLKKQPTAKVVARTRIDNFEVRLGALEARYRKLSLAIGKDMSVLQDRTLTAWELFWGLVEALGHKDVISVEELDAGRQRIVERWRLEDLRKEQEALEPGKALCETCFHKASFDDFADDEVGIKCPRCGANELPFTKEEPDEEEPADDSEPNKDVSEGE